MEKHFKQIWKKKVLILMLLPALVYVFIFSYVPIYGLQIAFKNFQIAKGVGGSEWVGLQHFMRFITGANFWQLLRNTLGISVYQLIASFPIPIIMAIMVHYIKNQRLKRFTQTALYAPHFISVVVISGMLISFLSPTTGIVNNILKQFNIEPIFFMGNKDMFQSIYVWSGVWQNTGWGMIIYLAALSGVDQSLHEAAIVDGAGKFKRILHIDIPSIFPTIVTLLIINAGSIMSVGFEKVYLLQNDLNIATSEIISTYTYKKGLIGMDYSFSTAVGLFNSLINCVLLVSVNAVSKKLTETSLW